MAVSFPLPYLSDASLERGNNIPKEMLNAAKEFGYKRAALVDYKSMSAAVKHIDGARSLGLGAIGGATLPFSNVDLEVMQWEFSNRKEIKLITQEAPHLNTYSHLLKLRDVSKTLFGTLTDEDRFEQTPKKFRTAIDNLVASGVVSNDQPLAQGKVLTLNEAAIKQEGVTNIFFELITLLFPECIYREICETDKLVKIVKVVQSLDFSRTVNHLVFVSSSEKGYKNLMSLVSRLAEIESDNIINQKTTPIGVTFDDINKYREGIVVIDSLDDSTLAGDASFIDSNSKKTAIKEYFSTLDCLGVNSFTTKDNLSFANKSEIKKIPFPVAHYINKSDFFSYCTKVAIHKGECVFDREFVTPKQDGYIRHHDEEVKYLEELELDGFDINYWDSIEDVQVALGEVFLPNYDMPVVEVINYALKKNGFDEVVGSEDDAVARFDEFIADKYELKGSKEDFRRRKLNDFCLLKLTMEGLPARLAKRFGENYEEHEKEYIDAINHEYSVIESMGFSGYFLIEYDMVSYARKIGVPVGPGRGSAAGSLIVYCLEITDVDPLEYDLQFERFLNPERVSMPDIDVDFGDNGIYNRGHILEYARKKYQLEGETSPSSCQIANIMRYQLKSSIAAVIRAFGLSMYFSRNVQHLIKVVSLSLNTKNITWDELLGSDLVKSRISKEPMLCRVLVLAKVLTGKMSSFGVHAGGVAISPTIITDFSSIACDANGNFFSELDKDDIERAGLIKFDVLGSVELSVISECVRQVYDNHNVEIDPRNLDFEDKNVYELISSQQLENIFQLKGSGMTSLVGRIRPKNMGELADLSALYRPGALDSGMVDDYVDVKKGLLPLKYDHPALEKVTKNTYGCIVYQEQVMSIVRELAGYSLGQADLLRRAMGKKKLAEMIKQRGVYTSRAMAFWREHYIGVGKGKFDFDLDVNLSNIEDDLKLLGVDEILDDEGYLSDVDNFKKCLKVVLDMNDSEVKLLEQRIEDFKYVVMLFQSHYMEKLKTTIQKKLGDEPADKKEELFVRLYYALSQYVRFNQIFNKVEKFAGYGFNKSHAIAYSLVTFQDAFFKCYYPSEFYSASLKFTELDGIESVVAEAKQHEGIKFLAPDVNKSKSSFFVESNKSIRYGLSKLKSVGNSGDSIIKERDDNGLYHSFYNFLVRVKNTRYAPNSSSLDSLTVTGAFDQFIPKRIMKDRALNGRQFMIWIRLFLQKTSDYKSDVESSIHQYIDAMKDLDFYSYITAIIPNSELKKIDKAFASGTLKLLVGKFSKAKEKELLKLIDDVFATCTNSPISDLFSNLSNKFKAGSCTALEVRYLTLYCFYCQQENEVYTKKISDLLISACNKNPAETLNEERNNSGLYITSNPLKVLNIAKRVEDEPPGSVIDGCPVSVSTIDDSYIGGNITTYGIVRDVVVKTTKKEDSAWYGEKMMFFTLDDGIKKVKCMIFGTKPTNAWEGKVVENDMVSLVAGTIKRSKDGLTLNVEVIKRYFPVEDNGFHTATKRHNKWFISKPDE